MADVTVGVRRAREHAHPLPLPKYQTEHAAGMDLSADIDEDVLLDPMERQAIPTGLILELPAGYEGQVRPRSGLALRSGITCLNTPGTIDADYRGEVQVILINLSQAPFTVRRGDRIAQLVVSPVTRCELVEAKVLSQTTRGEGGFGSTGR
jgi:dUTP pyrophosphatase